MTDTTPAEELAYRLEFIKTALEEEEETAGVLRFEIKGLLTWISKLIEENERLASENEELKYEIREINELHGN